jgi:hypothetical protein
MEPGNEPPYPGTIRIAKLRVQQPHFGAVARHQRRHDERREQHAKTRTKSLVPAQGVDQQPQIAEMADDTINATGDQRIPNLDSEQPAESIAEHIDQPQPQRSTASKENDTNPADDRRCSRTPSGRCRPADRRQIARPPREPPIRDVEAATLTFNGSPPITRTTFPTCRVHYPGGSGGCASRLLPRLTRPSPNGGRFGVRIVTIEMLWGGRRRCGTVVVQRSSR